MPPRLGCWAPRVRGARTGSVAIRAPAARPPLTRSRRVHRGESFRSGVSINALRPAGARSRGVTEAIAIGPAIADLAGNAMNQDGDDNVAFRLLMRGGPDRG